MSNNIEMKNKGIKHSSNAVVIIGNGFDLAHDMETSYKDFSKWFFKEKVFNRLLSGEIDVDIFNETFKNIYRQMEVSPRGRNNLRIEYELTRDVIRHRQGDQNVIIKTVYSAFINNGAYIKKLILNKFLGELYTGKHNSWFDIEQAYFDELVEVYESYKTKYTDRGNSVKRLKSLNEDFENVKELLKEYLQTIEIGNNDDVLKFFHTNFIGKRNVKIINFNYTKTISNYLDEILNSHGDQVGVSSEDVNYIHGELEGRIVFGYGDDGNEDYRAMKFTGINEFLENFKTFDYLHNSNYRAVINDLSVLPNYEVYVLGHSLGVTDKTLLGEIMDSDKCLNIHLFKRPDLEESYKIFDLKKLHFNLSRILEHDRSSRNKIVPIDISSHFPYIEGLDDLLIHEKHNQIYGPDWVRTYDDDLDSYIYKTENEKF